MAIGLVQLEMSLGLVKRSLFRMNTGSKPLKKMTNLVSKRKSSQLG